MKRIKPTSYVLPPDLLKTLRNFCELRGVKISWFVATAIQEKLDRDRGAA
jgi:hypothetical protein